MVNGDGDGNGTGNSTVMGMEIYRGLDGDGDGDGNGTMMGMAMTKEIATQTCRYGVKGWLMI